mmetsp:Transcript_31997/g.61243  ORF Transcript_31997/g.61243 Transcript_31997/m.61243 type:complete len:272 (+) Transcript_31997:1749-2564(+)
MMEVVVAGLGKLHRRRRHHPRRPLSRRSREHLLGRALLFQLQNGCGQLRLHDLRGQEHRLGERGLGGIRRQCDGAGNRHFAHLVGSRVAAAAVHPLGRDDAIVVVVDIVSRGGQPGNLRRRNPCGQSRHTHPRVRHDSLLGLMLHPHHLLQHLLREQLRTELVHVNVLHGLGGRLSNVAEVRIAIVVSPTLLVGAGGFVRADGMVGIKIAMCRRRRCCCCCCRCVIVIKIVVNVDGNARCRGGVILKIGRKHHWVDAIGSLLLLMLLLPGS